jgi:hypothetical protein
LMTFSTSIFEYNVWIKYILEGILLVNNIIQQTILQKMHEVNIICDSGRMTCLTCWRLSLSCQRFSVYEIGIIAVQPVETALRKHYAQPYLCLSRWFWSFAMHHSYL